jgi:1-acyl-sn-glycerol-3-phosphate acyltransferase
MTQIRSSLALLLLLLLKGVCRLSFHFDTRFVGEIPEDPWADVRLVAILNHTSLYEPVFAGFLPLRFIWRIARHAVIPVAKKTTDRPLVGRFFKLLSSNVVPITRQRDHTWRDVLSKIDDSEAMVILAPEGRMKRRNGLDSEGKPLTVRAGVADLILSIPEGRFLVAYSGGLHHIQAPGEWFPRPFKTVGMLIENLDLATYRERLLVEAGEPGFHKAVIDDLTRRRNLYCPLAAVE